jgi:hypothetical protein
MNHLIFKSLVLQITEMQVGCGQVLHFAIDKDVKTECKLHT